MLRQIKEDRGEFAEGIGKAKIAVAVSITIFMVVSFIVGGIV